MKNRNAASWGFGLGFAVFFFGVWLLPIPREAVYEQILLRAAVWAVGSIVTAHGILFCLLSGSDPGAKLQATAAQSVLAVISAITIFGCLVLLRSVSNQSIVYLNVGLLLGLIAIHGIIFLLWFRLARRSFYRACTAQWGVWQYLALAGLSLGSAVFFGIMVFMLPLALSAA